ncbi:hypothetical protein EYZ11_006329 [Aspergillus tanneri]|uniref:SMP-LTD domain-containing protein n=1 Tax=Aspergillus tanneri TaxID=1220188 RepID=A0A4S3JI70_9EURO|nr:uncharacterized protein ATNIH1004_010487 [Aspergillus tanneri]KAA8643713.1 hypothetical protein ATNIH1004_010487 [Aspergillus tanneri]THC94188.1 hypothetical protein EYZ11_006329 [Aspergillus tanneri]
MGRPSQKELKPGLSLTDTLDTLEQIYKESKVIVVGCLASWTLCRLNFSFPWLILLLAICRTYYQLSIQRVERAIRDELRRHHGSRKLQQGESIEWINVVFGRVWHLYQSRICDHIVRYVNSGLVRPGNETPAQKVIVQSLASMDQPVKFTKFIVHPKPDSPNLILEGRFQIDLTPPWVWNARRHLVERSHTEPLVNIAIVHRKQDHQQHDLMVQVKTFTGTGTLRLEFDLESAEPRIYPPQIELQDPPQIDCTMRTVSHHHFPFHFAHHVDWRKVVGMQIREGLGSAWHRPLPLPFLHLGERLVMRMMTWWWLLRQTRQN